jgi:hypothetical protein
VPAVRRRVGRLQPPKIPSLVAKLVDDGWQVDTRADVRAKQEKENSNEMNVLSNEMRAALPAFCL